MSRLKLDLPFLLHIFSLFLSWHYLDIMKEPGLWKVTGVAGKIR
jgi:hypothetical protein